MLEFSPSFPLEELKGRIEDGWFDEEVLIYLKNALNSQDKEKLLDGTIKPYDYFELDILIRDKGWRYTTITSDNYSDMDEETLKIVKERIDMLFEQAKKECGITNVPEEVKEKLTVEEAIEQLKDLRKDRESFLNDNDIKAIDVALKALELIKQYDTNYLKKIINADFKDSNFTVKVDYCEGRSKEDD